MMLSTGQPYFAPYPGLFHKIGLSDVFVALDDVQFPLGTTWVSRNRFKNSGGAFWMTIPVRRKGLGLQKISDVRLSYDDDRWVRKHPESLRSAYSDAPYFREHFAWVEEIFAAKCERLVDFNMRFLERLLEELRLPAKIVRFSELGITARGDALLAEVCEKMGSRSLLVQRSAAKYLDLGFFRSAGIELRFFNPPSPVYPQLWGNFAPNLSALDLLFNCGPKAREITMRK